jgi:phospholipase/carboxylesterase
MRNGDSRANVLQSFIHQFIPLPEEMRRQKKAITLLLLHGTGGNEDDLIPLGHELAPCSALLSPRGKVIEEGMPRFFKRFAEGVFDLDDLKFRTNELADFVISASKEYEFNPESVVAVGYSNGANIAASMLLLRPEVLSGAILFRAMLPLVPEKRPNLSRKFVFLSAGRFDPIIPSAQVEKLRELLQGCGAEVTLNWAKSNHSLTQEEIGKASRFLRTYYS